MTALQHSRPLALFGLLLANLCWSGNALVARAFAGDIAPFTLSFWRWVLALALLLAPQFLSFWPSPVDWRLAARSWPWIPILLLAGLATVFRADLLQLVKG